MSSSDLLTRYHQLSHSYRSVLMAVAVYGEVLNITNLKKLLQGLRWRNELGRMLYSHFITKDRDRLLADGFLVADPGGGFQCNPVLVDGLIEEARRDGLVEAIADAAHKELPSSVRPSISHEENYRRLLRDARLGALCGDYSRLFRSMLLKEDVHFELATELAEDFERILTPQWESVPFTLRSAILIPLLRADEWHLEDVEGRYARYEAMFREELDTSLLRRGPLVTHRIMHGDFSGAVEVKGDGPYVTPLARGVVEFMAGHGVSAFAEFNAMLDESNRGRGKGSAKLHLRGLVGVFYALAFLRENSAESRIALREDLTALQAAETGDLFARCFAVLAKFVEALDRPGGWADQENSFSPQYSDGPWCDLFQALAIHWLGGQFTPDRLKRLKTAQKKASRNGYRWFAREAALLLKARGDDGDYAADIAALDCTPLTGLYQPESAWERTLRMLQECAAPNVNKGGDSGLSTRVAWELDYWVIEGSPVIQIVPLEQKRRAKGNGWTKGRRLSIQRLAEGRDLPLASSAQDMEVYECVKAAQDPFRWYQVEYSIDTPSALKKLLGHPAVIWNGKPVELVGDQPSITVIREQDGIRIAMNPPNPERNLYRVVVEGERIRLYFFEDAHRQVGYLLGANGVAVPAAAESRVLETIGKIAPLLTVHSEIGGEVEGEMERVEADGRLHLQLQPLREGLAIDCRIRPLGDGGPYAYPGEGAASIFGEIEGRRVYTQRDLAAERALGERVLGECPALRPDDGVWDWGVENPEGALETLEALQQMAEEVILEWPQGKPIRLINRREGTAMQVRIGAQQDWFALSGELTLDDGRVMEMTQLLNLLDASPGRFVHLGEGAYLSLSRQLHNQLERIRGLQDKGKVHPLAAGLLEEAVEGCDVTRDDAWQARMARLAEAEALQPAVPSTLQARLREYQEEGFQWLARLAHWEAGACLADDMGLGKTVQTLALLLHRANDGPALVLAPTSVCANWMEEAHRFAPTLDARVFGGGDRQAMLAEAGPFSLILCSYGLLQSEDEALAGVKWNSIVADEAQAFKNPQTKRSKAVMALSGAFRMITTGTPIENHLGELWNLFRFINPGLLGSREHFNRRFAAPIEQGNDKAARERLRRLIRPFILRRIKSEVLNELPEKTEITHHVELSDQERLFYEALRRTALERISDRDDSSQDVRFRILAEITRLRRACCNPKLVAPDSGIASSKLGAFIEIVEELRDSGHKALVFSQFVDHLSLMRAWLDERQIPYQYLDGSTPVKKRQQAVQAFQGGQGDLFLISLKAGGAGLNLTAADYVIHLDPWWNPAVEDQASDRAHRMGQKRPVTIYRLVTRDTIEERIIALHHQKRDLADSLLSGADTGARMGVEEMMALLREE